MGRGFCVSDPCRINTAGQEMYYCMALSNREIAERLRFMAQLLEVTGEEDVFKVRAYERAAKRLEELPTPVSELDEKARLAIPGIGAKIAKKIAEIEETGTFTELEEL